MKMAWVEKLFIKGGLWVYLHRRWLAPRVLGGLKLGKEAVCLEIGCGRGAGTLLIRRYTGAGRIIGLDIDPDMIESARRYVARPPRWARDISTDNIEFLVQDAAALPFPQGYFDAVFLFDVLLHIPEWRRVIAEVYRVLKPGGVFSFTDFILSPFWNGRLRHVSFGESELKESLTASGLSIQSFERTKRFPVVFVRTVK